MDLSNACYVCGGLIYGRIRDYHLCETHYKIVHEWGIKGLLGTGCIIPANYERLKMRVMAENWAKGEVH